MAYHNPFIEWKDQFFSQHQPGSSRRKVGEGSWRCWPTRFPDFSTEETVSRATSCGLTFSARNRAVGFACKSPRLGDRGRHPVPAEPDYLISFSGALYPAGIAVPKKLTWLSRGRMSSTRKADDCALSTIPPPPLRRRGP